MNNKVAIEKECIRVVYATHGLHDIFEFLVQNKILTPFEITAITCSSAPAADFHSKIRQLTRDGKIQMFAYEWVRLPEERISFTLVAEKIHQTFNYYP